jgi:hypothetical protein
MSDLIVNKEVKEIDVIVSYQNKETVLGVEIATKSVVIENTYPKGDKGDKGDSMDVDGGIIF